MPITSNEKGGFPHRGTALYYLSYLVLSYYVHGFGHFRGLTCGNGCGEFGFLVYPSEVFPMFSTYTVTASSNAFLPGFLV